MNKKKKILVVFGTRPEAIKLAPLIKLLRNEKRFDVKVISTGQHKEMVKQVLDIFNIKVDIDLKMMKKNQTLFDITLSSIKELKNIFQKIQPDLLIVQGDTSTAFTSSLSAFYNKIKIAHVEAGLRSFNKYHPFPEEINRKMISTLTDYHFAPTESARNNLVSEGVEKEKIFVTGNTVVDSLAEVKSKLSSEKYQKKIVSSLSKYLSPGQIKKEFILVTLHRREKFGSEFENILRSLKKLSEKSGYNFIYPVHFNPNVQNPVNKILNCVDNFRLLPPLDYLSFLYLMSKCKFMITDSGGIQEESYIFKKPLLVLRKVTERMEAVNAGYAILSGSDEKSIVKSFKKTIALSENGKNIFPDENPFGSGNAARLIVEILKKQLF